MGKPEAIQARHVLPALPYAHDALEPHIDAQTMMLHHDKHHATYVEKLNAVLEKHPDLQERSAIWLLLHPRKVPEAIRAAVANNAGGHVNHSLFWRAMSPNGGGETRGGEPTGALADAIKRDFGSFAKFRTQFDDAGEKAFGSAWVWLARAQHGSGKLEVLTTSGHANPLEQAYFPILLNDVWEHAYYLKHQNRRGEYLKGWWPVVDWQEAARRFESSELSPEQLWDSDDELGL